MKGILSILLLGFSLLAEGQKIYYQSFGDKKDPTILFLHGGPGYNSASFEATSAQNLANAGYHVIVYDRRGEGRSPDPKAAYSFEQSFEDLNYLYKKFRLKKAALIGHSFGGMLATLYAEQHPEKVNALILVGAPINLQASFKNIIQRCKTIYQSKKDSVNLNYIGMLEVMDTSTIQYSAYCFAHAMQNGFYSPKEQSSEAKAIYAKLKENTEMLPLVAQMTQAGPFGFWKNEQYTTIDLTENIKNLIHKTPVYGLYGMEDGLYSEAQVKELQEILGPNNLSYLENCSHSVFIDQQSTFIAAIQKWLSRSK